MDALAVVTNARSLGANGGSNTTATLNANVINTAATADAAKALVVAITGGQAAVTAFDNALAAQKAVTLSAADQVTFNTSVSVAEAGVTGSFAAANPAVTLDTLSAVGGTTFDNIGEVYSFLSSSGSNAVQRGNVAVELAKVEGSGPALVAAADKALAIAKAADLVASTKGTLDALDNTATAGTVEGVDYSTKALLADTAKTTLANAQTADSAVAAVKVVTDQYAALNKAGADG